MGKGLRKHLPVSCCAALAMGIAGSVQAQQQMLLPVNSYYSAVAAGYWVIQTIVPVNGGRWVWCVDIAPATGWFGGNSPLDPQMQLVVPAGLGGWGWDNGTGFPCAQVKRTVLPDGIMAQHSAPSTGGSSSGAAGQPTIDLYNDLNRSNRSR